MKKRYCSLIVALSLVFGVFAFGTAASATDASAEKQLYHLAVEDKAFGSYLWGEQETYVDGTSEDDVELFPDNSMAAATGAASVDFGGAGTFTGAGWGASGIMVRSQSAAKITALGDVFQDSHKFYWEGAIQDKGESVAAHKVQLWKIAGVEDFFDNDEVQAALDVQDNWSKVAEVTVTPDKDTALGAGKGFNWTELDEPVIMKPGELYVIIVEQGIEGNPRPNQIQRFYAMHPDNIEAEVVEPAQTGVFYISGAVLGEFGDDADMYKTEPGYGSLVHGSTYCGGNLKYEEIKPTEMAKPAASEVKKDSAKITWTKAADHEVRGKVGGYIINRTNGEDVETFKVDGADTVSYTDTGLAAETTYTYEVLAVNDVDAETPVVIATYEAVEVTTPADKPEGGNNGGNTDNNGGNTENNGGNTNNTDGPEKTGVADYLPIAFLMIVLAGAALVFVKKKTIV